MLENSILFTVGMGVCNINVFDILSFLVITVKIAVAVITFTCDNNVCLTVGNIGIQSIRHRQTI